MDARHGMMDSHRLMMFLHLLKMLLLQVDGLLLQVLHKILNVMESLELLLHVLTCCLLCWRNLYDLMLLLQVLEMLV